MNGIVDGLKEQTPTLAEKYLALGIGCVWFFRKDLANSLNRYDEINIQDHYKIISKHLEDLPNVSNLVISKPDRQSLAVYSTSDDPDYDFFPFVRGLEISFDIHIPYRIQKELSFRSPKTQSEDFHVLIRHYDETPVAYITFTTDNFSCSPSDAVVVIRKFLENHFEKSSREVQFRTLGPSPFHADFYLVPENNPEHDHLFSFVDHSPPGVGYGDYRFFYLSSGPPNHKDALKTFAGSFGESISCYYTSVLHRNKLLHASLSSQHSLSELLALQVENGFSGWRRRLTSAPKVSRDLMISILQEQLIMREFESYVNNSKRDLSILPGTPFEEFVEKELDDVLSTPTSDVRETVKMFEDRYLKNLENGTVLFAGLIGGVIGSVITYLLGR